MVRDFVGPGDQAFARQNIRDWDSYVALFRDADTRVCGEASAAYLALPGVASEIRRRRPDAKIVIILRDPVERGFSAWQFLRGRAGLGARFPPWADPDLLTGFLDALVARQP